MNKRLPVTVVTGFLGAGKTTLLRYLLLNSKLQLAVMMNEFGSVGLDGDLIKTCGLCDEKEFEDRLIELNNGCLCCTVQDDFLPTIQQLLSNPKPLDGIIIETSGLALPRPLIQALEWPEIKSKVYLNGVITLVDSEALSLGSPVGDMLALQKQRDQDDSIDHITPINELFNNQLESADMVLMSRADLISHDLLYALRKELLAKVKRGTSVLSIINGKVDPEIILGTGNLKNLTNSYLIHSPNDSHQDHEHLDIISDFLQLEADIEEMDINNILLDISKKFQILRLKGRIWFKSKVIPLQIQMVGSRLTTWYEKSPSDSWKPKKGGFEIVILSLKEGALKAISEAFS